ncbi:MAG: GDSL-type esterase/lipase family protein, partial [Candidatus Aminicenantales bacterium]
ERPAGPTIISEKIVRALQQARAVPRSRRPAVIPKVAEISASAVVQPIELTDETALDAFFAALHRGRTEGGTVRIAYYGDSIVEGDLITQDLRASFQKAFGGGGAGFLPIASEVAPFRITVIHDFSLDWKTITLLQRNRPFAVGISGQVFVADCPRREDTDPLCAAWVEYKAPARWPGLKEIRTLRLFYSRAEAPAAVEYAVDDREPASVDLDPGEEIRQTVLKFDPPAKKVRLTVRGPGAFPVYGASWDGDDGVQVDNFALRGNSGLPLAEIPAGVLRAFDGLLDYRLIVLHFGTNVASPDQRDYSWYRAGMARVVRHFRDAFPKASILLIGTGDRSFKDDAEYVTIPTVPILVETQRKAAEDTGAAFWDLYGAMGGLNSMVGWVNHKPVLAALDYTHLSAAGSRRVAEFLYNALMARFKTFEENLGR